MEENVKKLYKAFGKGAKGGIIAELILLLLAAGGCGYCVAVKNFDLLFLAGGLVLLFGILLIISLMKRKQADKLVAKLAESGELEAVTEDFVAPDNVVIGGKAGGGKKMVTFGKKYIVIHKSAGSSKCAVVKYEDIVWVYHIRITIQRNTSQTLSLMGIEDVLGEIGPFNALKSGNEALAKCYEQIVAKNSGCLVGLTDENRAAYKLLQEEYKAKKAQ